LTTPSKTGYSVVTRLLTGQTRFLDKLSTEAWKHSTRVRRHDYSGPTRIQQLLRYLFDRCLPGVTGPMIEKWYPPFEPPSRPNSLLTGQTQGVLVVHQRAQMNDMLTISLRWTGRYTTLALADWKLLNCRDKQKTTTAFPRKNLAMSTRLTTSAPGFYAMQQIRRHAPPAMATARLNFDELTLQSSSSLNPPGYLEYRHIQSADR
jgi:hypothetical protein